MVKLYITFGQFHTHSHNGITLDKDCVGVIKAKTYSEARDLAFEWFDGVFATTYTENKVDEEFMKWFPRGIVKLN